MPPKFDAAAEFQLMAMMLLTLARDNKFKDLEGLAKGGMPMTIGNQMGQTALHIASLWGNIESMEVLLKAGADANTRNMRGSTPLHFAAAAKKNAKQACEVLLKKGADTEAVDMMGRAPYEMADSDEVRVMLGGPDPRLFDLAGDGKAEELRKLLAEEAIESVRVMDSGGRTPLNLAILSGNLDAVKAILEFDPKCLDMPDAAGDTAMHTVVEEGHKPDILAYLLSLKPKTLNAQNMNRSEYSSGNWLLRGEVVEPLDKTPLMVALESGNIESAQALIEAGADLNILNFDKRAPIHLALEEGEEPIVELLLQKGADPNVPSQDLISCLHYCATRGPIRLLHLFLEKGGNVKAANEDGWTPLHLSCRSGKADRAEALIKAGADVNAVNSQGSTPLHLAAVNGHLPIVQLLREAKADITIPNKQGKTAAEVAKTPEIAEAVTK
ncbi:ankyrin repeat-containing domain protein [Dunaliella salina]|uniref:Ankyrin repeat-containing domain protein n=1 Tax=Dunaliella salina TaxID=3046 RepID=A0ABQ7GWY9_DUNSA|nr:ankyrin repeat-containing domain protein [Dunaliella salina]|eukprot:KAF5839130.1 ankyrin repeat-containing domain protein [Dunaliella salina]